jgi:hypothetical protein
MYSRNSEKFVRYRTRGDSANKGCSRDQRKRNALKIASPVAMFAMKRIASDDRRAPICDYLRR